MLNKREFLLKYVIPIIGDDLAKDKNFIEVMLLHSRLHTVVKHQFLESPGSYTDGHLWFSIDAMTHNYYICLDSHQSFGRQIWKKREFIFDNHSFYRQEYRSDYIQAIEPGIFISISFPALKWLEENFLPIKQHLVQLSRLQHLYYRNHAQLLGKHPFEKVKAYIAMHPLFSRVANNTINGMHVGLTRQGYENQLKKL